MLHDCTHEVINVAKLGRLDTAEVNLALFLANQLQRSYVFQFSNIEFPLDESFRLPNGGYDLSGATQLLLRKRQYNT